MISTRLRKLKDLNQSQRWLLTTLCGYANDDGDCWPSQTELAEVTGLSRRTVVSHLKVLCQKGYIESQKRMNANGDLDTCLYSIKFNVLPRKPTKARSTVVAFKPRTTEEKLTDRSWDETQFEIDA